MRLRHVGPEQRPQIVMKGGGDAGAVIGNECIGHGPGLAGDRRLGLPTDSEKVPLG